MNNPSLTIVTRKDSLDTTAVSDRFSYKTHVPRDFRTQTTSECIKIKTNGWKVEFFASSLEQIVQLLVIALHEALVVFLFLIYQK